MSPSPYFEAITSPSAYKKQFQKENAVPFPQVSFHAASSWEREHLFAFRVVRRKPRDVILPMLQHFTSVADVAGSSNEIKRFFEGPETTSEVQSEHALVRSAKYSATLGQVWAAMAAFNEAENQYKRPHEEEDNDAHAEPDEEIEGGGDEPKDKDQDEDRREDDRANSAKRSRQALSRPGMVSYSHIRFGSSDPTEPDPLPSSQSSVGYVSSSVPSKDMQPEDATVRLISCTLRHILYHAAPQDSDFPSDVIEFRDTKRRLVVRLSENKEITAIDDGGLCLRRYRKGSGFLVDDDSVALLEAKKQFQHVDDGAPAISD
ncbi:hypothetical protein BDV12DRAFT_197069 [Aspergillus spectabilis]